MEKDGLTRLAMMLKERDPKTPPSITTGFVVSPPPDPRIRLNDIIVLENENLVFTSRTDYEAGDEVILIPVPDGQLYYVIDKAVRF